MQSPERGYSRSVKIIVPNALPVAQPADDGEIVPVGCTVSPRRQKIPIWGLHIWAVVDHCFHGDDHHEHL